MKLKRFFKDTLVHQEENHNNGNEIDVVPIQGKKQSPQSHEGA
jgi:hypothetical protein